MKNNKIYGIIYKITNKVNNKVYIGQTTRKGGFNQRYECKGSGIERVYNYSLRNKKDKGYYNIHLFNSIKKYGFSAFEVVKEFDIAYSREELNEKEQCWIKYYKSNNKKYGYNKTLGGEGVKLDKEVYIRNMGEGKRYRPFICTENKKVYLIFNEAVEDCGVNIESLKRTLKHKQKSVYSKKYNKKITFRYITISNGARKPVICLNNKQCFLTLTEARDWCHLKNNEGITACCEGRRKSAGKHPNTGDKLKWMFALDYKLINLSD